LVAKSRVVFATRTDDVFKNLIVLTQLCIFVGSSAASDPDVDEDEDEEDGAPLPANAVLPLLFAKMSCRCLQLVGKVASLSDMAHFREHLQWTGAFLDTCVIAVKHDEQASVEDLNAKLDQTLNSVFSTKAVRHFSRLVEDTVGEKKHREAVCSLDIAVVAVVVVIGEATC
jgi:hypothetical protein